MQGSYPRDMIGYGGKPPHAKWPGGARVAVQVVINYEEGGENNILHGDKASEAFLSEIVGAAPWPGQRHMNMESIYEYGARAGFWRLRRIFHERGLPVTVFGVATALARNPGAVSAMKAAGWEIASHGYKWIDYKDVPREAERADIGAAVDLHMEVVGERPLGFYQGRTSENTLPLVVEHGGFLYSADSYADDLPYWLEETGASPQLIVPYTLDANDMRFATAQGFNSGTQFYAYLKDSLDVLCAEGDSEPKMLSIGLHCRLAGRPGRAAALMRFLDYAAEQKGVWFATRLAIARHWIATHPPASGYRPSRLSRAVFLELFGGVFEHSPWVAAAAYEGPRSSEFDTPAGLCSAMSAIVRAAPRGKQLALINAHPDLAGKLALAGGLTPASASEQASAGLDRLSPEEFVRINSLNEAYKSKFGFVFVLAVRGLGKDDITTALANRLGREPDAEFNEALTQIDRIALTRLRGIIESRA